MSDNNVVNYSSGLSFPGLITIVFIILKLTNVIAWSWWWILAPIWISWVLILVVFAIAFICFLMGIWLLK